MLIKTSGHLAMSGFRTERNEEVGSQENTRIRRSGCL